MYIEPNSTVKLLHNVKLYNNYYNTIYFSSLSEQLYYFSSKVKKSFDSLSYQRVNRGKIRLEVSADDVMSCNYLMFQNTSFSNKWFYAFITKIDYINNSVAEISYQIDVIQTWITEMVLNDSFIERSHTEIDTIGSNIVPEKIELGEYVFSDYNTTENSLSINLSELGVMVGIVDVTNWNEATEAHIYDNIFSGCELFFYRINSPTVGSLHQQALINKVKEYIQSPDSIVCMYMCPANLISGGYDSDTQTDTPPSPVMVSADSLKKCNGNESFGSYVPKNKKLYTYPYNFLYCDNGQGNSLQLRYEFFTDKTPKFIVRSCLTQPIRVLLSPTDYKGINRQSELSGYPIQFEETLTLSGYPNCSWNYDTFSAWLAQNSLPLALGSFGNLAVGNVAGATGNITSALTTSYQKSIQADVCKGSLNNGTLNCAINKQSFNFARCHVNENFCKIIDDYFTKYGYAINEVKKPNISSRTHWNYIKTINANISGNIPSDDLNEICNIFDNGITFWKNGDEIGDYSLNNWT